MIDKHKGLAECLACKLAVFSFSIVKNPPIGSHGSFVHGISQARIQEWAAVSFCRGLPDPGVKTTSPTLADGFFTIEPPGKPRHLVVKHISLSTLMLEYRKIYYFHCTLHLDSYCVDGFHKNLARIS